MDTIKFNLTRDYIPMNEKLEAIQHIILSTLDSTTGTYPVGSVEVFETVTIARLYTDIELAEDIVEAYDYLAARGFDYCDKGSAAIDIRRFRRILHEQIEKLEKYQTSAYGILDSIKNDYDNLNFDLSKIQDKINSEEFKTLKEITTKLG